MAAPFRERSGASGARLLRKLVSELFLLPKNTSSQFCQKITSPKFEFDLDW